MREEQFRLWNPWRYESVQAYRGLGHSPGHRRKYVIYTSTYIYTYIHIYMLYLRTFFHDSHLVHISNYYNQPSSISVIPRMFRVSAIAPVNIPIVSLMLICPATNVPGTLFLHWVTYLPHTAMMVLLLTRLLCHYRPIRATTRHATMRTGLEPNNLSTTWL